MITVKILEYNIQPLKNSCTLLGAVIIEYKISVYLLVRINSEISQYLLYKYLTKGYYNIN